MLSMFRVRQYFRLTLTDDMRSQDPKAFEKLESLRVLYLYHTSDGAVKIPREWHTSAPYSSKATEAQRLVASTLVDVDQKSEAESLEKEAKKAKVKRQLLAEYEEKEATSTKKHEKEVEKAEKKSKKRQQPGEAISHDFSAAAGTSNTASSSSSAVSTEDLIHAVPTRATSQVRTSSSSVSSSAGPTSFSAPTSPRKSRPVADPSSSSTLVDGYPTTEMSPPLILTTPGGSRSTTPSDEGTVRHVDETAAAAAAAEAPIAEQLFHELPLTPFLPQSEDALELEAGETDLADISDDTDPALHGHVDADKHAAALDTSTSASSASSIHAIPRGVPSLDTGNYNVVLHFHGGGFVSGSPSSHESYLRTWANTTNAIVFSVDYSLGPDHKYPVAFNECYFFYRWLVSEDNALGVRPKKVVLSGDSAGGNLAVSVALKACEAGIRVPDGLVVAYPALNCTKGATPSRLVFGNDILVPYYFLEVCLDGYVDADSRPEEDYCLSPVYAPDELISKLPDDLVFMVAGYDPLLDDTVRFLRRLDKLNKPYLFEVFDCPHGFWNFDALLLEAERAMYRAGNMIRCMFDPLYARTWQLAEEKHKRTQQSKLEAHQQHAFSVEAALRPYENQVPPSFCPLSQHEIIHHLAHASKPKSKKAVTRTADTAATTSNSATTRATPPSKK